MAGSVATLTSKRLESWPRFVRALVADAVATLQARRIWVFGSQARGDRGVGSDWDIAFELSGNEPEAWKSFCRRVHLDARTLHEIDLVNLADVGEALREAILRDGVLVYEHTQTGPQAR